jgi:beta-glucosidase
MGIAAVRGFQGDASFKNTDRVIATLKHFVAHGQPESGMNCAPANVSERVLRETFLFTFKEAIDKAGAISLMASYNEVDGVPSHANKWLLRDVLRKEWKFKGFIVRLLRHLGTRRSSRYAWPIMSRKTNARHVSLL